MTKRSIKNDLSDISDHVLGNLDPGKRLRMSLKALAEGDGDTHKRLLETTPMKDYTLTDPKYTEGVQKLFMLSLHASYQLRLQYQALMRFEAERDKQVLTMLLNEALARLARDEFGVDEFGNVNAGDHAEADYAYGMKQSPDIACLATKYRQLWDDLPFELAVQEDKRDIKYFPELAAGGLIGYPDDLSAEAFDDIEDDRIESEANRAELQVMVAVVNFYTHFHGWRLFAEEHIGVSLDEFLGVTMEKAAHDDGIVGAVTLDEKTCRNVLSLKEDYLDAYPDIVETAVEGEEDTDLDRDLNLDLNARARERADRLEEAANLPVEQAAE